VVVVTLDSFERAIEQLEEGSWPAHALDRVAAVGALIDKVRRLPVISPQERKRAQALIARLQAIRKVEKVKKQRAREAPPER
jgi:hypothetical protein